MDSPNIHPNGLKTSLILFLIISLTFSPSNSDGSASTKELRGLQQKKLILGSKPPGCFNKCLSCKPCKAALVISPRHRDGHRNRASSDQRDEGYYPLSWKCKCGNKFFDP